MSCKVLELLLLLLIFTRPCHGECSSLAKKEVIEAALQEKWKICVFFKKN